MTQKIIEVQGDQPDGRYNHMAGNQFAARKGKSFHVVVRFDSEEEKIRVLDVLTTDQRGKALVAYAEALEAR